MAEPFYPNQRFGPGGTKGGLDAWDPTDMVAMVNAWEFVDSDKLPTMISGGNGYVLHGGNQRPRVGR